jgi:aminoglycoside/choline kinase family phosphotransferase
MKLNKKNINYNNFRNDFEILSVIRNLKIIGIFSRLAIRDKKIKYLRLIPYAWELIDLRIKNNMIFRDLKKYLDFYYPTKIRKKNAN